MKYQLLLPIVPVWLWQVALTTAQSQSDLGDLPQCATAPAFASIGNTGCELTDSACICKNSEFIDGLSSAVRKDCSADEVTQVQKFANDLCGSYGVTVGVAAASSTATPASATATGPAANPTGNANATASSGSGTATTSPAPTQSGGAVAGYGSSMGIGILGALGAVAAGFL